MCLMYDMTITIAEKYFEFHAADVRDIHRLKERSLPACMPSKSTCIGFEAAVCRLHTLYSEPERLLRKIEFLLLNLLPMRRKDKNETNKLQKIGGRQSNAYSL